MARSRGAQRLAFSRTFSIPANKPQEVKDAAFYAIYRLSHPDYSLYSCADPYCGLDPVHGCPLFR